MLKIIAVQENHQSLRVQLYGEFTGESVVELEIALAAQGNSTLTVTLALSYVTFVDRAGMKYLCGAQSKNISIENLPSYVSRWMEQEGRNGAAKSSPSVS